MKIGKYWAIEEANRQAYRELYGRDAKTTEEKEREDKDQKASGGAASGAA